MTKAHITSIVSDYINPTGLSVFSSDVRVSGVLSVQNIPVSVSGHNHSSSDINNFNSSVSGLLPPPLEEEYVGPLVNSPRYGV